VERERERENEITSHHSLQGVLSSRRDEETDKMEYTRRGRAGQEMLHYSSI
jgi:hypothetical protein